MKLISVFLILITFSIFCIAQNDSIPTIFLERVNSKGKTVIKEVVPWKSFIIQTNNERDKFLALVIDDVLDSSLIITRKCFHEYISDTIQFNEIKHIFARTKNYNLRRGLGIGLIICSSINVLIGIQFYLLPGYDSETKEKGIPIIIGGVGSIISSNMLVRMRRFNTESRWVIKTGYYQKKRFRKKQQSE